MPQLILPNGKHHCLGGVLRCWCQNYYVSEFECKASVPNTSNRSPTYYVEHRSVNHLQVTSPT